jgi:hypothetical protein
MLVEGGLQVSKQDDVVTRLGLDLGSQFGGQLQMRNEIESHLNPLLAAESLGLFFKLEIRGRYKMIPGQHAELALLGCGWWLPAL